MDSHSTRLPPIFPFLQGSVTSYHQSQEWVKHEEEKLRIVILQSDQAYANCHQASLAAITTSPIPPSLKYLHLDVEVQAAISHIAPGFGGGTSNVISSCDLEDFRKHWSQKTDGTCFVTFDDLGKLVDHLNALWRWWNQGGLAGGNFAPISRAQEIVDQAFQRYKHDKSAYVKMVAYREVQLERKRLYETLLSLLK